MQKLRVGVVLNQPERVLDTFGTIALTSIGAAGLTIETRTTTDPNGALSTDATTITRCTDMHAWPEA